MKIPFADDFGAVHCPRPQSVDHHVIRMKAQQQIGINGVVADSLALVLAQAGQEIPPPFAIHAHGFRAAAKAHEPPM